MELILPKPGRYVLAVSGGLDSVCLLDIFANLSGYEIIVAHFDHAIRSDSWLDAQFVAGLAKKYGVSFVLEKGNLRSSSEAEARVARYAFLFNAFRQYKADSIITAHHQDDRIETLVINLIRGTGRLGVGSIKDTALVKRPLLKATKAELKGYALQHKLIWREDSTNSDERYLRNYIRANLLPKLSAKTRKQLVQLMDAQQELNKELDLLLAQMLDEMDGEAKLSRKKLVLLNHAETKELIATWLRTNNLLNFDHRAIERLSIAAKTKPVGSRIEIYGGRKMVIEDYQLALH